MSSLLKNLLTGLGLAIVLFGGVLLIRNNSEQGTVTEGGFSQEAELETQRLLSTLNELKSFNVDGAIFTNPLFLSLQDFRVEIGNEPQGRSNPFAPVQ